MPRQFMMIFYGPKGRRWALVAPGRSPEEGTTHQGAPGGPSAPWWVVLSSGHPPSGARAHYVRSGPKKIPVEFRCIWTPFGIDFM